MEFIETSIFTRQIQALLSDDAYKALQSALIQQPDLGDVIQGTGGARKMRWNYAGRGKSYGLRVIYVARAERIYLLLTFEKSRKSNLTPDQRRALAQIIKNLE